MNSTWKLRTLSAVSFLAGMFIFLLPALAKNINGPLPIFYAQLVQQIKQPYSSQISFLKSFINEHPGFEEAYLKLVERSILADRASETTPFLRKLTNDERQAGAAYWALARLYEVRDRPDSAFIAFKNAAGSMAHSLSFYADFIRFDMQNNYRYSALQVIEKSSSEPIKKFSKAVYLNRKGNYEESNEILSALKSNDKAVNNYISDNSYFLGQYSIAEKAVKKNLAIAELQRDLKQQATSLNSLFTLYWLKDQRERALKSLSEANEIAQKIDDKRLLARISINLNFVNAIEGNYKIAANANLNAAATFIKFHDYRLAARAYNRASDCFYTMSHYSEALEAALQSLALFEKIQQHYEMIKVMITLSKIYRDIEQDKIGLDYLNRAAKIAGQYGYEHCLEEIDISRQKLAAKEASLQNAVAIYKNLLETFDAHQTGLNQTYCYHMCAQKYEKQNDIDNAKKYYKMSLEASKREDDLYMEAWTLSKLAELEKNTSANLSPETFRHILSLSKRVDDRRLESSLLISLGDYYEGNEEYEKAINHYLQAMKISESLRDSLKADEFRIGFLSKQLESYRRLSELYAKLYKKEKHRRYIASVFHFEEMQHARSLKDEIQRKLKKTGEQPELEQDYQHAVALLRKRQLALRRLKDKQFDKNEFELLLANMTASKYDLLTEKIELAHKLNPVVEKPYTPIKLVNLQSQLQEKTVLIYHLSHRKNFVLAINADSVDVIFLPDSMESIKNNVDSLVMPMHYVTEESVAQTPFHAQIAYRLYLQLFRPVEEQFPLEKEIFILPEKEIASLPFEMLLYRQPTTNLYTPKDAPDYVKDFLIYKYAFFYGPSIVEFLKETHVKQHPSMLLMANPFENEGETPHQFTLRFRTGWRFERLPFAKLEMKRLKKLIPNIHIITGSDATEKALKQNAKHDIIHIATHAFADTVFEAFSGLALAVEDDSTNDGLLQGFEITDINFDCDLVVLSACETGRGKAISGEGVLALPRQFLLAGVHSVIMSQWKVDDYFTAMMMPKFYANYLNSTMNKAGALKQSKIDVLSDDNSYHGIYYQHPFFWASFNLYGDPGQEHPPYRSPKTGWAIVTFVIIIGAGLLFIFIRRQSAKPYTR